MTNSLASSARNSRERWHDMADRSYGSGSARPGYAGPLSGRTGEDIVSIFDFKFDSGSLHVLRARVETLAVQAGMPRTRAADVVLVIHELAANAVRHGAGLGRLQVRNVAGALHCQVDDGDPPAREDHAGPGARFSADGTGGAAGTVGRVAVNPFPYVAGHGLWVVRQVADQMQVRSGPRGTRVTITFELPELPRRHRWGCHRSTAPSRATGAIDSPLLVIALTPQRQLRGRPLGPRPGPRRPGPGFPGQDRAAPRTDGWCRP